MSIHILKIPIQTNDNNVFIKQGDTIPEIIININGIDLSGAIIRMQLYKSNRRVLNVQTGNGITNISSTSFKIDEISANDNNLPSGILKGDLEVGFADGTVKTLFNVWYTIYKEYTI
jgi:hypothetical protein